MKLPHYTDIGCYPIVYLKDNGDVLCADCASSEDMSPKSGDVNWEGESLHCHECAVELESA